ncbi:MAG: RDD family protein [Methylococcales bacterium]
MQQTTPEQIHEAMLDTLRRIETPEGVQLDLRVAGPVTRACAWMIDSLIRSGIYILAAIVLSVFGNLGVGLLSIVIFWVEWFYPVFFELYKQGATPGKRSLGIKVVNDDGTEVTPQSSLIRNLLRGIDFLPLLYGFGLISMLYNPDFKRLGDLAAGTLVVYQDKPSATVSIMQEAPRAPPVNLTANEQKAVIEFAERCSRFTPQRCSELANMLQELTHAKNEEAVHLLLQYANWMIRRR